ncbi:DUF1489 family protein (plasmid) [Pseudorhodobacter turbinis]|uniref:DUF1489 family protein n=1 Tax=Pseudorhodobacter turbinis TaxID=2500533 RepID=A0A4P8EJQ4_9RHOB|nr:DUF1489 domain-containing protein [Pseudorhodobacter turbinis]QCO57420.1 DUF1489 family protein [Pseudorhodobacter turbinis]
MADTVNLLKLCVGANGIDDLAAWQEQRRKAWPDGLPRHVTRMWPKRGDALLNGGSLYWVFKGVVLARQTLTALEEQRGEDGILRCALVLDPQIIPTEPAPRRPFQGWRYLSVEDAPRDLPKNRETEEALPPDLARALADIGLR